MDRAIRRNAGCVPGTSPCAIEIAVGEQHRRFVFVGFDAGGVDRHHVRPVEEVGDAAKTLGLALRAIGVAGAVKPHELGIAGWIDDGFDVELERPVRRLRDGEPLGRGDEVFRRQRLAVERERDELQLLAVEHERRRRARGVGLEPEFGAHPWSRSDRAIRRDRRSRSASRAGGNPAGGQGGVLRCASSA